MTRCVNNLGRIVWHVRVNLLGLGNGTDRECRNAEPRVARSKRNSTAGNEYIHRFTPGTAID